MPISLSQHNWRWYQDNAAEPTIALANENATPTLAGTDIIRLRFQVATAGGNYAGWILKLQFSTDDYNFYDLDSVVDWNYADGKGTKGDATTTYLCTDSDQHGNYHEDALDAENWIDGKTKEIDFAIQPANFIPNQTYYFRGLSNNSEIPLGSGHTHPSVLTSTPSASESPSVSPSASFSLSPSASPSLSPSASESPSESPSLSPSASESPSMSPSISPSESPSASPSLSPSASVSPSASPSLSPSASISPSPSPSLSPSASISPSKSPSPSPSMSPSKSPSASPSVSPSEGFSEGEFNLPAPQFTGTSATTSSRGEFVIPLPVLYGTSKTSTHSSGQFVLPKFVFTGRSSSGSYGIFKIPMFVMSDGVPGHSSGEFVIPVPEFSGYGRLLPISRIYRGIVMNLLNQAISTYSNYNFNSIACFNGRYLGATDTGIYPLNGNSDNGIQINSKIKTGSMDFGDTFIKYIRDAWITFRTDGHLALVILVDEKASSTIEKQTSIVSDEIREERIKPPRGLKGRFYTVELKNLSGADFDIDSLNLLVESIRRKVR